MRWRKGSGTSRLQVSRRFSDCLRLALGPVARGEFLFSPPAIGHCCPWSPCALMLLCCAEMDEGGDLQERGDSGAVSRPRPATSSVMQSSSHYRHDATSQNKRSRR